MPVSLIFNNFKMLSRFSQRTPNESVLWVFGRSIAYVSPDDNDGNLKMWENTD